MTKRMLQALQMAGVTNVEAFPVILKNVNTQEEIDSYVAFNIVGLGSMADIKEAKANGLVFRPSESLPDIVIHRSLKSTLLESGISTLTFHKI